MFNNNQPQSFIIEVTVVITQHSNYLHHYTNTTIYTCWPLTGHNWGLILLVPRSFPSHIKENSYLFHDSPVGQTPPNGVVLALFVAYYQTCKICMLMTFVRPLLLAGLWSLGSQLWFLTISWNLTVKWLCWLDLHFASSQYTISVICRSCTVLMIQSSCPAITIMLCSGPSRLCLDL